MTDKEKAKAYEVAKLLKEKGFRCDTTDYYYDKDGDLFQETY